MTSTNDLKCLCEAILNDENPRGLLKAYARSYLTVIKGKEASQ